MTNDQKEFMAVLRAATDLGKHESSRLADELFTLAAVHHVLSERNLNPGLSPYAVRLWDHVETAVHKLVDGVVGITDVRFDSDPRASSTVGLAFATGAHNSLTGTYRIPVNPTQRASLMASACWEEGNFLAAPATAAFFVVEIKETGNAAFTDGNRDAEIARMLRLAADHIETDADARGAIAHFALFDINGNSVGHAGYTFEEPTGEVPDNQVRLAIALGNAAFEDAPGTELARILREAAERAESNEGIFALRDVNGNLVGKFQDRRVEALEQGDKVDMLAALMSGKVYRADDGYSGLADGAFRYLVPAGDFEPGYHQEGGDAWLVNAAGEKADGYADPQYVREVNLNDLTADQRSALLAVAEGRMSLEEHERPYADDELAMGPG